LLELDACVELYCERAEIVTAHVLAGILASLILCDKLRTADCALRTLLVEDVNDANTETQVLIHIPVDATECLPVAVEVECLLKVGVCLAEVAETEPSTTMMKRTTITSIFSIF